MNLQRADYGGVVKTISANSTMCMMSAGGYAKCVASPSSSSHIPCSRHFLLLHPCASERAHHQEGTYETPERYQRKLDKFFVGFQGAYSARPSPCVQRLHGMHAARGREAGKPASRAAEIAWGRNPRAASAYKGRGGACAPRMALHFRCRRGWRRGAPSGR